MGARTGRQRIGGLGKFYQRLGDAFHAFAEAQFELNQTQDEGGTMRDHLEAWERATGKSHPMLSGAPTCPDACETLWLDFNQLSATRQWVNGSPMRITFGEIDAFQRVQGIRLEAWEIGAIKRADGAFLAAQRKGKA